MTNFNIRVTLEVFLHPIDLDENMQYVRCGLGREIELDADPEVVGHHFLSDPSFLGIDNYAPELRRDANSDQRRGWCPGVNGRCDVLVPADGPARTCLLGDVGTPIVLSTDKEGGWHEVPRRPIDRLVEPVVAWSSLPHPLLESTRPGIAQHWHEGQDYSDP